MTTPAILAREFSRVLRATLDAHEVAEVIARNRIETSPSVCHSHDFCDANMVMLAAFEAHGLDATDGDTNIALWNAAWDLAVKNEFSTQQ
jgi:hypothetical protein